MTLSVSVEKYDYRTKEAGHRSEMLVDATYNVRNELLEIVESLQSLIRVEEERETDVGSLTSIHHISLCEKKCRIFFKAHGGTFYPTQELVDRIIATIQKRYRALQEKDIYIGGVIKEKIIPFHDVIYDVAKKSFRNMNRQYLKTLYEIRVFCSVYQGTFIPDAPLKRKITRKLQKCVGENRPIIWVDEG